jgi:succinate dehydrogenase / fumarate reductase flavoprotein subunit
MIHEYEAIIVGAGGAGLYAALEASRKGKTAVVSKLFPIRSHTGTAQGGIGAALGNLEEDRPEWHAFDTIKGGDYLVDQDAAKILVEEAVEAVYDLEHRGLPFSRTPDGKIDQRRFGGHTKNFGEAPVKRSCYAADRTGHMILQTLYQQCIKNNVSFFDEFFVLDVIIDDKKCNGIIALELATGDIHIFKSKCVMFGTGGFGRMFKTTSNAYANTGDGPAVLFRKGVPLMDMEFFQFHPTGIAGMGILITEAVRGEGGVLRNKNGEQFMEQYAPTLLDLAPRDLISRAILTELKKGNGVRGDGRIDDYVLLDATHLGKDVIYSKLPDITEFSKTYLGIDPADRPIPVQPTAHYAMGGIPTDINGRVLSDARGGVYEGLYAAGECACVSVHVANRLGTNSLVDLIVFGKRSGIAMADFIKHADYGKVNESDAEPSRIQINGLSDGKAGIHGGKIRSEMQETMMENVGIFRNDDDMKKAVDKIAALKKEFGDVRVQDKSRKYNTDMQEILELSNLLDCAYVAAVSALNRTETRGAHSRDDFPERNDKEWLKHTMVSKIGNSQKIEYKNVDLSMFRPKPRTY